MAIKALRMLADFRISNGDCDNYVSRIPRAVAIGRLTNYDKTAHDYGGRYFAPIFARTLARLIITVAVLATQHCSP